MSWLFIEGREIFLLSSLRLRQQKCIFLFRYSISLRGGIYKNLFNIHRDVGGARRRNPVPFAFGEDLLMAYEEKLCCYQSAGWLLSLSLSALCVPANEITNIYSSPHLSLLE